MQDESAESGAAAASAHPRLSIWRDGLFWVQFGIVLLLTGLAYWLVYRLGVAHDCAALGGKQDVQCGLATAMGKMFGVLVGLIVLVVGTAVTLFRRYKRNHKFDAVSS